MPLKIAYICMDPGVPIFGTKGCSIHLQEFLRAVVNLGMEAELFVCSLGGAPPSSTAAAFGSVPIHHFPIPDGARGYEREQAALALNSYLRESLEQRRDFHLIYERYALWSFAAMEYAREAGIPGFLEVNAPLIKEQAEHRQLFHREYAEQIAQRTFSAATLLIAVSKEVAYYLRSLSVAKERIRVLPNGVNPNRFPRGITPSCPAPAGIFTVGFLGSMKPWHGLPQLVEAFAMLRRVDPMMRLLVVGDGPQRSRLTADLQSQGLIDSVHLTGAVAPSEVPGLLASMDAAVAPYSPQPNFYFSPLKLFEYMAAELPVVASRIGQVAEVIRDEVNGLLVPPGDPIALAAAIHRLKESPDLGRRLGQAARATVLREHTWNSIVECILNFADLHTLPEHQTSGRNGR